MMSNPLSYLAVMMTCDNINKLNKLSRICEFNFVLQPNLMKLSGG